MLKSFQLFSILIVCLTMYSKRLLCIGKQLGEEWKWPLEKHPQNILETQLSLYFTLMTTLACRPYVTSEFIDLNVLHYVVFIMLFLF